MVCWSGPRVQARCLGELGFSVSKSSSTKVLEGLISASRQFYPIVMHMFSALNNLTRCIDEVSPRGIAFAVLVHLLLLRDLSCRY